MDKVTQIVPLKTSLIFGPYPNQTLLDLLKQKGVTTLVDLTSIREIKKKDRYTFTHFDYIKYPIRDCRAPTNIITFKTLVDKLVVKYKGGETIYVHCRGGHGRSGLLTIVLLKEIKNISLNQAIIEVRSKHQLRPNLSEKVKKLSIPQTRIQKQFLNDYYNSEVYFYDKSRIYYELSNFYSSNITIKDITYPTVEHYYQSQKYIHNNDDYIKYRELIRTQNTPNKAYYLARRIKRYQYKWMNPLNEIIDQYEVSIDPGWEERKVEIMKIGLLAKYKQHKELRDVLLSTCIKKIYEDSPRDSFWGLGKDKKGKNMLGKLLMQIRDVL